MNNPLPPSAMLMHLVAGKFVTQALAAAAELNVAEQLVDSPKTADEIAETMEMHAASLYRLMRALAEVGVLTEDDGNRFALTATGQLLTAMPTLFPRPDSTSMTFLWFRPIPGIATRRA